MPAGCLSFATRVLTSILESFVGSGAYIGLETLKSLQAQNSTSLRRLDLRDLQRATLEHLPLLGPLVNLEYLNIGSVPNSYGLRPRPLEELLRSCPNIKELSVVLVYNFGPTELQQNSALFSTIGRLPLLEYFRWFDYAIPSAYTLAPLIYSLADNPLGKRQGFTLVLRSMHSAQRWDLENEKDIRYVISQRLGGELIVEYGQW